MRGLSQCQSKLNDNLTSFQSAVLEACVLGPCCLNPFGFKQVLCGFLENNPQAIFKSHLFYSLQILHSMVCGTVVIRTSMMKFKVAQRIDDRPSVRAWIHPGKCNKLTL